MSHSQEDIESDLIGNILLDDPTETLELTHSKSAPLDFHKSHTPSQVWRLQPNSNFLSAKDYHRSSYHLKHLSSEPPKSRLPLGHYNLEALNTMSKTNILGFDSQAGKKVSSVTLLWKDTNLQSYNPVQNKENVLELTNSAVECTSQIEIGQPKPTFYTPDEKKVNINFESSYFSAPIRPKKLDLTSRMFEANFSHQANPFQQSNPPYNSQSSQWHPTKYNTSGAVPFSSKGSKLFAKHKSYDFLSNLLESCKDQYGSRLIQQYLENADLASREKIFRELVPFLYVLMMDVFGNYIIQKILEIGTIQQKLEVYKVVREHIIELSCHTYGCRVIQKILEEFKSDQGIQDEILQSLKTDIFFLIEDPNSNHVIQKCFEIIPCEKLSFIVDAVINRIDRLCMNGYGCRVIQRMLEYCKLEQTIPMLKKLMANTYQCCQCQYGNYLMQFILEKGPQEEKEILLQVLKKNFIKFSLDKFASNVTEKSIIHSSSEFKEEIVDILISNYYDNKVGLVILMTHPYGNYVLQKLFESSNDQIRRKIYAAIINSGSLEEIKRNIHGKHVMGFIEKLLQI